MTNVIPLVKHWPHLHAQPTPIKVHILQYLNEVFTFTAATGIFLFNVNQHFQKKPSMDTRSVVLFFFWQNSHPMRGNEESFSICSIIIILHYFLAHLHRCLVATLALLNMLSGGGREHDVWQIEATDLLHTLVQQS